MLLAITRAVSRSIVNCELTHLARTPIDVERARSQHAQYEAALRRLGVAVLSLPEEPVAGRLRLCGGYGPRARRVRHPLAPRCAIPPARDRVHRPGT